MSEARKRRRDELEQISRLIDAPDSWPGRHMRIKRENQSREWNEAADTKRFEANLESYVKTLDDVAEILATKLQS